MKGLWYDLVVLIDARGDVFVGVCKVGLTLVGVVVVEIWGESCVTGGDLLEISMEGREWSERELWYCPVTFIDVREDAIGDVCNLRLPWGGLVGDEIGGEVRSHSEICAIFGGGGC